MIQVDIYYFERKGTKMQRHKDKLKLSDFAT